MKRLFPFILLLCLCSIVFAQKTIRVKFDADDNMMYLAGRGTTSTIVVDENDDKGVKIAAKNLATDIGKVSGYTSHYFVGDPLDDNAIATAIKKEHTGNAVSPKVICGTIGKNAFIDEMIAKGRLDVSKIKGTWEAYLIQTLDDKLVIAGSDRRGTIFGIYHLSEMIGVSPWYFWADVPVQHHDVICLSLGKIEQESPKVKYRGIFLNDEWPSLGTWAHHYFGGFNSKFYESLSELVLRLRANYIWPAMWNSAMYQDDPLTGQLVHDMGVVVGTSHHEPMMRAHKEYVWGRDTIGAWNYERNPERIEKFFHDGMRRAKDWDKVVTIGMRGDGDVAMEGGDDAAIKNLAKVIEKQREIIEEETGKPAEETPQLWAIFTEVQRYYDRGMTAPDDVMLVFCDNNWGYIRRAAPEKERNRKCGLGLYYHIDMNGGPWNDRWVNTTTVAKMREQLGLAYQSGLDDLWIINVGDLKPKEMPIDFIMRDAWNPDAIAAEDCQRWMTDWARRNFGERHAKEIGEIVNLYSKYNLWRKAETQSTEIYSVMNNCEAERVDSLWQSLSDRCEKLWKVIPTEQRDAFFQLVYYPAMASSTIARIWTNATINQTFARQGRTSANRYAEKVDSLYKIDQELTHYYNNTLAEGKWKHMMSDLHLGYTQWSMPQKDSVPETIRINNLRSIDGFIVVEGDAENEGNLQLPVFDNVSDKAHYFDFADQPALKKAPTMDKWIVLNAEKKGEDVRYWVRIDWAKAPKGRSEGKIKIGKYVVNVSAINNPSLQLPEKTFGNLSGAEFGIEAYDFAKNTGYTFLPDLGRGKGCMGIVGEKKEASLSYNIYLSKPGKHTVLFGLIPTQDINPQRGLRFGVSLDGEKSQVVDARQGIPDEFKEYNPEALRKNPTLKALAKPNRHTITGFGKFCRNEVFDNIRWVEVEVETAQAGLHTLTFNMIDPEIVLERIIVDPDDSRYSYFGADYFSR